MNRRQFLKWGASAGAVVGGVGLGGAYYLLPPRRSRVLEPVDVLAARLYEALDDESRATACVDYEHPLRQYHNRGVWGGGLPIRPWGPGREVRGLVNDLLHAGLSEQGRARLPGQFYVEWPGAHVVDLLICGDPRRPPYQLILTGPHLNLRLGGASREGVAFGGPQVYGDQRGNGTPGLPGNVYRYQFETAKRLWDTLPPEQQSRALLAAAPIQTQIEPRGAAGPFPGVELGRLPRGSRAIAEELVDGILSTYAADDVGYARSCLERNGGVDALHLSYYDDGEEGPIPIGQVFRLEGPAAVFYFRGHPHVHAFLNVAMDGDRPLSVGEVLGRNPAPLEGAAVKALFEAAMRGQTGSDFAHYPSEGVVGRLRAGTIRTGDVYNLETWQDALVVADVRGADLAERFRDEHREREGRDPLPDASYTIATSAHAADTAPEQLGEISASRRGERIRDVVIAHLRERGFPRG